MKRSYEDRLSVTPAPGAGNTLNAFGSGAGYARTGNGNGGGYHDERDGDEDDDEDDDEGEYDDDEDASGYGQAGYAGEGSIGTKGNEARRRGMSEDDTRLASGSGSDRTPTGVNQTGTAGEEGGAGRSKRKAREGVTCDNCRKRKVSALLDRTEPSPRGRRQRTPTQNESR
jgi:hypothetical protein